MPCSWKRCRDATSLTYLGVSLCQRHWELLCEWIEKLECGGAPVTRKQINTLLGRSTTAKRDEVCPKQHTQ